MSSRIAKTEYNDIFLLDEFYLVNAERYPAERAITALGLVQQNNANNGGGGGSGGGGGVRSVSKLNVQQPLLDRPAILKDNRFLQPSASEKLILDLYKRQQLRATTPPVRASSTSDLINGGVAGNSSFSMRGQLPPAVVPVASGSAAALTPSASTAVADDSDDEDDDAMNVVSNMAGKGGNGTDSKEALLAQDVERTELMDFIARRREELHCTLDDRYLTPTTITVVGVVMAAKLQCDPPEVLRFPLCKAGETASRAIRLTNPTRTPLDFRVRMDGPFRITRLDFIPADGEEDLLSEDDEEGKNATRNTRKLLLGSTKGLAANNQTLKSAVPTAKNALLASSTPSSLASTKRTDPNSDPANTLFHLRPRDSVDLTVELSGLSTTSQQHKHALDGALTVLFQGCPLTQVVPCLATVHTPSLVCDPEQTWFRPPVVIRDGKPQPKYPRNITLVNHSNCPAPFSVRHMARMDAPGGARVGSAGGGETLQRLKKVQAVVATTPLEEHAQLFDDPSRFTIFPMNGVVPAATKGGAPGRLVIQIQFHEYSFMKYESRFRVDVEGGVGSDFVVRGDSREVEV
ncbi:Hypothetical protein, putative [Bodo saltans]|uniref:Uncharacterized protein n=1 Tax=Bodo saltans TaxID=75058 RepID=A0A0S4J8G8_BODSA|nr:Hypothetical protein, putative [Bodo saltans]|eukprot:CUG87552.1 Hypothetical protein, putative [Bodo saltans]